MTLCAVSQAPRSARLLREVRSVILYLAHVQPSGGAGDDVPDSVDSEDHVFLHGFFFGVFAFKRPIR